MISAVWMSLTGVLNSHLMMAHLIHRFGTPQQRDAFLPPWPPASCGAAWR